MAQFVVLCLKVAEFTQEKNQYTVVAKRIFKILTIDKSNFSKVAQKRRNHVGPQTQP